MFLTFTASVLLIQASSLPGSDETRPTHRFNLQDCIDYAIKNHTGLLNQRLNQAIYHKYLYEALGQYLPQVSAGATYQYNIKQQVAVFAGNTITIGTKQQFQGHIDVDQAIFSPSYIGSIGSGKLQLKIQDQNTQLTEIDLVVGVKKAYYGVLVAREQMTLFDANIKRSRKEMSDTRYKYENGLAQQVDIDRIQVLVNNAITQKKNAERSLQTQMQSLKYFMGMPVNDSLQVTGAISEGLLSPDIAAPDSQFYKKRIEYLQAEVQLRLSKTQKRNVTLSFFPTLSAFATYQAPFYGDTFESMFDIAYHPTIYAGLQVSLPIFSGLSRIFQRQAAELNIKISRNNLFDLKNNILLEFNRNYRLVKNDNDNLKTQKANIRLAQKSYENLKYQYDNGLQPIINVLDAETTLLEAQNNYINALYQLLIDQVDLEKSLGRIEY